MRLLNTLLAGIITTSILFGCAPQKPAPRAVFQVGEAQRTVSFEIPIQPLELSGLASLPNAEFSGMAWYKDWLILLPQYPSRFPGGAEGALLALSKQDILDRLDGKTTAPLTTRTIPLLAAELASKLHGYEGFESIAIVNEQVFLTIETNSGSGMLSYLVKGVIDPNLSSVRLDTAFLRAIPAQAAIANFSDEAITTHSTSVFTFYEANGAQVNFHPIAHQFNFDLTSPATPGFPNLDYRITDATPIKPDGTLWVINYFYPGDTKIAPASKPDPLALRHGIGATHASFPQVERLVQLKFENGSFHLTDTSPIQLALVDAATARNWEGLAELEGRGFLLITDQYPKTILAFLPYPLR